MSQMRRIIAQRMIESRRTSAHVHCMFEVDMTRIVNLRNKLKNGFEQRNGARLTFMPFFVRAAIVALQHYPVANASLEGDNVRYHHHVNAGIAVALDNGLIVPVLKNADELNFLGLQRGITDLGERARTKKLSPDDVQRGTFTITNPGVFGSVIGTPIINQPQAAILCVGAIEKQPAVITVDETDTLAVRTKGMLSLAFDHRIAASLDGVYQHTPLPHTNRYFVGDNRVDMVLDDGATSSLWWATKNEWLGLLDVAGLELEALYGGFANEPFDDNSREYVFSIDRIRMVDSNLIQDLAEHLQILGDAARANRRPRRVG
jgi:hypothetical protein